MVIKLSSYKMFYTPGLVVYEKLIRGSYESIITIWTLGSNRLFSYEVLLEDFKWNKFDCLAMGIAF
jgi:hypothetical protein